MDHFVHYRMHRKVDRRRLVPAEMHEAEMHETEMHEAEMREAEMHKAESHDEDLVMMVEVLDVEG